MAKREPSTPSITAEPQAGYARGRSTPMRLSEQQLAEEVTKPLLKEQVRATVESGVLNAFVLGIVLNIASAQVRQRLAGPGTMAPAEAERVKLAEELMRHGTEAFGDRAVFLEWLNDESPGLDGKRPIDLMRSITGMRLVMDELVAIEHGMPL